MGNVYADIVAHKCCLVCMQQEHMSTRSQNVADMFPENGHVHS